MVYLLYNESGLFVIHYIFWPNILSWEVGAVFDN